MEDRYSVIIPAAGKSSRIGTSKALLEYAPGVSFADHLAAKYRSIGCEPVVMVISAETKLPPGAAPSAIIVMNDRLDLGRQHSIRLGLERIPYDTACFLHNIDNPYAEAGLLTAMEEFAEDDGYIVPEWNGLSGHPVLLGKNIVKHLKSAGAFQDLREELTRYKKIALPWPDEGVCRNINTREDYLQFKNQNSKVKI